MISTPNSLSAGSIFSSSANIFLHLISDGRLKLFKYYYTQSSPGMYGAGGSVGVSHTYSSDNFVLQLDGKDLMQPRGLSFRKDMLEYLGDCPHVARMIESRDLKRRDTEIIVQIYNDNCAD